ncbi:MAG: hypothetical protein QNJ38_23330 [Prochloraceae cyanobacterium]|nr:hypothetical protein [Prochloraceae cyanobacterium]
MKSLKQKRIRLENWLILNWRLVIAIPQIIFLMSRDWQFWRIAIPACLSFCLLWFCLEKLANWVGINPRKIRGLGILGIVTIILSLSFQEPASAFLYKRAEKFVSDLITSVYDSINGGSTTDIQSAVALLFTFLRVLTVFMFLGSLIQAQRMKNDTQSSRLMLDIAAGTFEFVVAVEVISFLLVG